MQCKYFLNIFYFEIIVYYVVSSELMQQRQRVGDLEEELELLHKQLRATQLKVVGQVKDFYL
jgi:hypothetical protein